MFLKSDFNRDLFIGISGQFDCLTKYKNFHYVIGLNEKGEAFYEDIDELQKRKEEIGTARSDEKCRRTYNRELEANEHSGRVKIPRKIFDEYYERFKTIDYAKLIFEKKEVSFHNGFGVTVTIGGHPVYEIDSSCIKLELLNPDCYNETSETKKLYYLVKDICSTVKCDTLEKLLFERQNPKDPLEHLYDLLLDVGYGGSWEPGGLPAEGEHFFTCENTAEEKQPAKPENTALKAKQKAYRKDLNKIMKGDPRRITLSHSYANPKLSHASDVRDSTVILYCNDKLHKAVLIYENLIRKITLKEFDFFWQKIEDLNFTKVIKENQKHLSIEGRFETISVETQLHRSEVTVLSPDKKLYKTEKSFESLKFLEIIENILQLAVSKED